MLDQLTAQPADALLALIKMYAADDRPGKIDLGVGVYRDADGGTPVFRAIKAAEQRLIDTQDSKSYLGPEGDQGFVAALAERLFPAGLHNRLAGVQTPGGTGAVRLAGDLLLEAGSNRIFLGTPSWPNHAQILDTVGFDTVTFRHMDIATQQIDFDALMQAMEAANPGDTVLLHGCCHNPTGADYPPEQWQQITDTLVLRRLFPLIDIAYHGLGHGFAEDSIGVQTVLNAVPEALVAYSCDKNFGLYRERVGALYWMAENSGSIPAIGSNVNAMARASWSMPPDHGAASVRIILEDDALTQMWLDEVDDMRARMRLVRQTLGQHGQIGSADLGAVARQNGLFSTLALSKDQVATLRDDHAIYMAGSGRINIAGLTLDNIPGFVAGLRALV